MSKWTEFKGGAKFRLIEARNKHSIEQLQDDDTTQPFVFHTQPFTLQQKSGQKFYDAFYEYARGIWTGDELDFFPKYYKEFCQEILSNKVTAEELAEVEEAKKKASEKRTQKAFDRHYEDLYSQFRGYMEIYGKSALELVVATSRCLVADSVREVIRAFVGYFQTITGIKATNVIAIGSPASGKSFILETALSMMPQEYVHYGIMTESAFFETFDGQNLDGHIFMLGDLGGAKDDEKSIVFRDLLKALSTDGMVSRTISKKGEKDVTPTKQVVKGHPALTYSTANEEIVNEQEKSRSVILTPQPINPHSLSVFDFVMENNGIYRDDIDKVYRIRESIQGLVYCFNLEESDGFVNPYEYHIIEVLKDKEDYNRKIQEYKATLKVVTLLDKPYIRTHSYYKNEDNETVESRLIFASKRNNLNAMNLFDAVNFLPDEARFGDKLLEHFEVIDVENLSNKMDGYDESNQFAENLDIVLKDEGKDWFTEETNASWKRYAFFNGTNGYFNENYPKFQKNVFCVSSLRKKFRGKWFNQHKHYLSNRLRKLRDEDIIIKLGETTNHENLYCLNNNNGSKISEKLPSFDDTSLVDDFKHQAFEKAFPNHLDDWDDFIEWDEPEPLDKSLTESVEALFPNLPYVKGGWKDV